MSNNLLIGLTEPGHAPGFFMGDAMEYQEFPKWVTGPDGAQKLVNSADEQTALGDGWTAPAYVPPVPHDETPEFQAYPKWVGDVLCQNADEESALLGSDSADERAALIQIAAEKGVKIDKRWSDDKIRAALEAA